MGFRSYLMSLFVLFLLGSPVFAGKYQAQAVGNKYEQLCVSMVSKVLKSGPVMSRLELSDEESEQILTYVKKRKTEALSAYMGEFKNRGECSISAINKQKYKSGSAEETTVFAETSLSIFKPIMKDMKGILSKDHYLKFKKGVEVMGKYAVASRKLMKSGKKSRPALAKIFKKTEVALDRIFKTS